MILLALALAAQQALTLTPTDDLWVYPHAADFASDPYLRVWGVEGEAVPADGSDAESYGMSYLKWSLAGVPSGGKLRSAKLVLTHIAEPGYMLDVAKKAPIEARAVGAAFTEKAWNYEAVDSLLPKRGDDALYGTGAPDTLSGGTLTITIDLLSGKGDFAKALKGAAESKDREIAIALTSRLDISGGRTNIYKVFSKDEKDEKSRPKLVLEFE